MHERSLSDFALWAIVTYRLGAWLRGLPRGLIRWSAFQFYFVLGPGMSFGRVDTINEVRRMTHIGGQAGAGVELRLAPAFALNADVRGVIRHRIDSDPRPEFFDGVRGTNTSGGAVLTFGGTIYF